MADETTCKHTDQTAVTALLCNHCDALHWNGVRQVSEQRLATATAALDEARAALELAKPHIGYSPNSAKYEAYRRVCNALARIAGHDAAQTVAEKDSIIAGPER